MSKAISRTHPVDRFYNPLAMRHHRRHQLLPQKQHHGRLNSEIPINAVEVDSIANSDESTLCTLPTGLTNLDRVLQSVTPAVCVQYSDKARLQDPRTRETDKQPFFCLGDLWESFKEWSVYGVGVPFQLSGGDTVKQYYVPSLSGIQLYIDSSRLRFGADGGAESSRETTSAGSSDCETEKRAKGGVDGVLGQHDIMYLNLRGLQRLALRDRPLNCSFNKEPEISSSHGWLVYEYLEQELPHHRKPLYDKVSTLASRFPELQIYRSCDLSPASWISVAWYPIYRIPTGPTLQNLDASFLTFHSLSTNTRSENQVQFDAFSGRKACSIVASSKIALPVFGLASHKLRGSILTPRGAHEWQHANSLLQAADNWLRCLEVNLPDFQFFVSHNS